MSQQSTSRLLRLAAAAILALALPACDDDRTDPQHARELPCNLADDECAARPAAADAIAVLEAMGIDPDHTDVQLVNDPHLISGIEPTDEPAGPDALKSEDPTPIGNSSCNGAGATFCCCFWDAPGGAADAPASYHQRFRDLDGAAVESLARTVEELPKLAACADPECLRAACGRPGPATCRAGDPRPAEIKASDLSCRSPALATSGAEVFV
jgi:hypothetical protein